MQRNYLIKLAYDGAAYHGWQIQENARTVQQVFQEALQKITGLSEDIKACSRTGYRRSCPGVLRQCEDGKPHPAGTAVGGAEPLPSRGRGGAVGGACPPGLPCPVFLQREGVRLPDLEPPRAGIPFCGGGHCIIGTPIDEALLDGAAQHYLGSHDFTSFCTLDRREKGDLTRTVTTSRVERQGGHGHLHCGGGRLPVQHGADHGGDAAAGAAGEVCPRGYPRPFWKPRTRKAAGPTAPAQGLYLNRVFY